MSLQMLCHVKEIYEFDGVQAILQGRAVQICVRPRNYHIIVFFGAHAAIAEKMRFPEIIKNTSVPTSYVSKSTFARLYHSPSQRPLSAHHCVPVGQLHSSHVTSRHRILRLYLSMRLYSVNSLFSIMYDQALFMFETSLDYVRHLMTRKVDCQASDYKWLHDLLWGFAWYVWANTLVL